jgi:hypothetical protein
MRARIYKPDKVATQSGLGKAKYWVLEYETRTPRHPESLMGWTASGDTLNQVRLTFNSREEAENYARQHNIEYTTLPEHTRKVRPRNYGDNFRYLPEEDS